MRKVFSLCFVLTMLSFGCKSKKNISSEKSAEALKEVINFSRGACFGNCPIFELTVFNDRKIYLDGKRFVDHVGLFTTELSTAEYNELMNMIETAELNFMDDTYHRDIADLPTSSIRVHYKNLDKSISGNAAFPEALNTVMKKLDGMVQSLRWKKIDEMEQKYSRADGLIKEEIILQLKKGAEITSFLKPFEQYNTSVIKKLSTTSNLYLITYDTKKVKSSTILEMCKQNELVESAEFNKVVSVR